MTKIKKNLILATLVVTFLTALVGMFLTVNTATARADTVDTSGYVEDASWKNGDDVFSVGLDRFFRFYYSQKYTDASGNEQSDYVLYVGSATNTITLTKDDTSTLKFRGLKKAATGISVFTETSLTITNITEEYVDFNLPLIIGLNYQVAAAPVFYEDSGLTIESERIVAIVAPAGTDTEDTTGASTDTSTSGTSLPSLENGVQDTSWKNGDNIFDRYLRFYSSATYIDESGNERTEGYLYIGAGETVGLYMQAGKNALILFAEEISSGEEMYVLVECTEESNEEYIDFYLPSSLLDTYKFESDLTFYEGNAVSGTKSTRVIALTVEDNEEDPPEEENPGEEDPKEEEPGDETPKDGTGTTIFGGLFGVVIVAAVISVVYTIKRKK